MIADTDDFLVSTNDKTFLEKQWKPLENTWKVAWRNPMEQHSNIIIQIKDDGIHLRNQNGIEELLQDHSLSDYNHTRTPHIDGFDLTTDTPEEILPSADLSSYQSIVGSLLYVSDSTHPEFAFIVGLIGHNLQTSIERHVNETKRILRYLEGVRCAGINYKRDTESNKKTQPLAAYAP